MTNNLLKFVGIAVIMAIPLGMLGIIGGVSQEAHADACASSSAAVDGSASSASGTTVVTSENGNEVNKCGSASSASQEGQTFAAGGNTAICFDPFSGFLKSVGIACAVGEP
jgi:hypothetical protein